MEPESALLKKIADLENENASLRKLINPFYDDPAVKVPAALEPIFQQAQKNVSEYFKNLKLDHTKGTIEINDQRYVLVRASAFSKAFLETIQRLYADRGASEAFAIGRNFLFDYAHVIGMNDARNFHEKMKLQEPIEKLSAGPVHFAFSGWAFVDISPDSNPTPDENFFLSYTHPFSFEADSWIADGMKSSEPVCIMNAGYSSGWCEESFGIPLTAVEVKCMAKGDDCCQFIMSTPDKVHEHLARLNTDQDDNYGAGDKYNIPTFFDRKRVEEEMERSRILAEESAQAKSDFIANMSHELRTPLGAILGFTELMKKTGLSEVQQDYLQAIESSGSNLLSIINNVLDLSKIDAGKIPMENIVFSVPELMQSVQTMLSSRAALKSLRFSTSVDTAINFPVSGDPTRLTQILTNLIGNAIKFTDKGGVYVNCILEHETETDVVLCFSVRDTGIGIPADKLESIFERFTQADAHITRQYGGTGLGLAITRQLVELQGGKISVKAADRGAEFCFTLPYLKAQHAPAIHQQVQATTRQTSTPKTVLIIDDNEMNRKLAGIMLTNHGFIITSGNSGEQALKLLSQQQFDVILMDIQMPGIDGYETAKKIRQDLSLSTPIIAMTAHALSGEKDRCLQSGFNDYIAKPFREADLVARIQKLCDHTENGDGLIDLSFLMIQTRNNRQFVREMMESYLAQAPSELGQLEEAMASGDDTSIYQKVHTIRNMVGLIGLGKLIGSDLQQMETHARAGNEPTELKRLFYKTRPILEQSFEEISDLLTTWSD